MTEYAAQINAGIVSKIIVGSYVWANENLLGEWVDCTCGEQPCAGVGYTWDGTNFAPPVIEPE